MFRCPKRAQLNEVVEPEEPVKKVVPQRTTWLAYVKIRLLQYLTHIYWWAVEAFF